MKTKETIGKVSFAVGLLLVGSGALESIILKIMEVIGW